jgi:hypothetical protein
MASNAPPRLEDLVELGLGRLDQLGGEGLDHVGAVEDVVVLEQVGLVGQHLLHPQRPLLVPRAGQAERLVPRRQLERPGPGRLDSVTPSISSTMRCTLFSGWASVSPEAVDLHAVAEPAGLGVGDAVALEADASHSSVKARILQVSSTKRMPAFTKNEIEPNTWAKRSSVDLARLRTASSTPMAVASE